MSDFNARHNRAVWFDIPVANLERAASFYRAVLGIQIDTVSVEGFSFCVLAHEEGNGGGLVPHAGQISSSGGGLGYMNAGRRPHAGQGQGEGPGGQMAG